MVLSRFGQTLRTASFQSHPALTVRRALSSTLRSPSSTEQYGKFVAFSGLVGVMVAVVFAPKEDADFLDCSNCTHCEKYHESHSS